MLRVAQGRCRGEAPRGTSRLSPASPPARDTQSHAQSKERNILPIVMYKERPKKG